MKKETLVSIAERSGCSISTVSRVLSGNAAKYRISQRTVARVTEEVKRCNYTPSLLAKGLRTNRTDTIGLLIPNIENSFFANVAGVVIRESRERIVTLLFDPEHNLEERILSEQFVV